MLLMRWSVRNWLYLGSVLTVKNTVWGIKLFNICLSFVKDRSVALNEACGDSEENSKPYCRFQRSLHFRLEYLSQGLSLPVSAAYVTAKGCYILQENPQVTGPQVLWFLPSHSEQQTVTTALRYSVHFTCGNDEDKVALCLIAHHTCKTRGQVQLQLYALLTPTPSKITLACLYSADARFKLWLERPFWWFSSVLWESCRSKASVWRQQVLPRPVTLIVWESYCLFFYMVKGPAADATDAPQP
jgi:hypothetical protein